MPPTTPTTEVEAVNIMLSGIGESPVNSLAEMTADVSMARHILHECSKEIQCEGFQWNTEDNFPLSPDVHGYILVPPSVVRIHFREPTDREITIRGNRLYDRINHTYSFAQGVKLLCTVTLCLPFEQLPEAARRYTVLKSLRVFQERVVGSSQLSQFHQGDEARARALMLSEERRQDRPNLLKGTLPPTGTWQPYTALTGRG